MIYVPMLKTRREELSVVNEMNYCFSENLIPLFEILDDKYEVKYKMDPKTSAFLYQQRGKRRMRIKEVPTDSDIITLRITNQIDTSARDKYIDYEFSGFGDYCGLKDALPTDEGGNGTGAALALLYVNKINKFYSFCNHDTSEGLSGYNRIIPLILSKQNILNPSNNCPAMQMIEDLVSTGSWATWNNITITRYIHQIYDNT